MNILFITSTLPRFQGDHQPSFVADQAEAWKKSRPQDNVIILAPHYPGVKEHEEIDSIKIFRFKYWWPEKFEKMAYPAIIPNLKRNPFFIFQIPFFLIFQFLAVITLSKKCRIDLIYAHWVVPQGIVAYLAHKLTKIPYVLQNHSSDVQILMKTPLVGPWLLKKIINTTCHLFCVNQKLKDEVIKVCPAFSDKVSVLPMGVSDHITADVSNSPLFTYDIGFIGRLSSKKGVEYLLKALDENNELIRSLKIGIAGSGELDAELKNMADKKGLNIHFLGFLQGEEKKSFLNHTKTFVFPSVERHQDIEGLPVALLEALILNKGIIASSATNITLIPEWALIQSTINLVEDPRNIKELQESIIEAFNEDTSKIDRNPLKRYYWKNLINEYLLTIKALLNE